MLVQVCSCVAPFSFCTPTLLFYQECEPLYFQHTERQESGRANSASRNVGTLHFQTGSVTGVTEIMDPDCWIHSEVGLKKQAW